MLNGKGDYCKTLCPVCNDNILLGNFKVHMTSHKEFVRLAKVDDKVIETLYQATNLKNVLNNVYYNWDYHIQTNYEITEKDRNIYKEAKQVIEKKGLEDKYITDYMIQANPEYTRIIAENIVSILSY